MKRARGAAPGVVRLIGLGLVVFGQLAAAAPGDTTRVSVASDGAQANAESGMEFRGSKISADGRFVVFRSSATNLVSNDSNGFQDTFVHDRQTGETTLVSVATDGTQANEGCGEASISADGRFVSFYSRATNLVSDDTNSSPDIFVHDRQTGETTRVSVASGGGQAQSGGAFDSALSADGQYVAFVSNSDLVSGYDINTSNVFVHDRMARETTLVSVSSGGYVASGASDMPAISANGQFVAFVSGANDLVTGDINGESDIFVRDRQTGETTRVSVASDGTQANHRSAYPSISADGRYVAFGSYASNLVVGDTNGVYDVFVHDRQTRETTRVSVSSDGAQKLADNVTTTAISADGRFVGFYAYAPNLVSGDTNAYIHIFVRDRQKGETALISRAPGGSQANGGSIFPSISADGRFVSFYSEATDLVSGDTNGTIDVFVHEAVAAESLTAKLAMLSKSVLDFGVAAVGQSAMRTIRVQNVGTGLLQVTTAPPAPYVAVEPTSLTLAAGAVGDLKVAFSPVLTGRQDVVIPVLSNGGNLSVSALGYAVKPTTALPAITSQVPTSAAPYSIVSLKGRALGWTFGTVKVAGQTVNSTYWSDSAIDVVVPELPAGMYPITVTTADGRAGSGQLTILGPSPVITKLRPTSGTSGSNAVIVGANFGYSADEVSVTIGGASAAVIEWATDWLRVKVPEVPSGLHPVVVTTGAGSVTSSFRVRPLWVTVEYGECVDYFSGVLWRLLEAPCPPVIATVTAGTVPGTTTLQLQNLTAKWYSMTATPVGIGAPVTVSPWIGPKATIKIPDLAIPAGASLSILADGTTLQARTIAVVDGILSLCPALGVKCPRFPATASAVELVKSTMEQSNEFVELSVEIYESVANGDLIDTYAGISDLLVLASEDPYVGSMFMQLGMDVDTASANAVANFLRVFKASALALESVFAPPFGTVTVQAK